MVSEKYKSTFQIIFVGFVAYLIQKALFFILKIDTSGFQLSLENTYAMMVLFSAIIMTILNLVFQKNKDVVGMTFLLITSIKVVIITIIGKTYILTGGNQVEKWNFFGLFALFLFFETYLTARRLNSTKF
ncbi:MAG: hypothetical protein V4670_07495 [Bacteroidota bacterium]